MSVCVPYHGWHSALDFSETRGRFIAECCLCAVGVQTFERVMRCPPLHYLKHMTGISLSISTKYSQQISPLMFNWFNSVYYTALMHFELTLL